VGLLRGERYKESGSGHGASGVPDLRWINRCLPIADVAKALDLRFGEGGMVHCWHPEKHQNGDRTPSVGIRKATNRAKCFGCGSPMMSVVDLVRDCLGVDVAEAARWIDGHFDVPHIPKRRHLEPDRPLRWCDVGHEQPIELLVKSGVWAGLSPQAQRVAPVLLCLAAKEDRDTFRIQISDRALMRYSGVKSFSSVGKAKRQLEEIEWLECLPSDGPGGAMRPVTTYRLTPYSDGLTELANAMAKQNRQEIAAEREMRKQQRRARRQALNAATRCVAMKPTDGIQPSGITEYKPLYTECSVGQDGAPQNEASKETKRASRTITP
jgi:predicted transcriptional regulator